MKLIAHKHFSSLISTFHQPPKPKKEAFRQAKSPLSPLSATIHTKNVVFFLHSLMKCHSSISIPVLIAFRTAKCNGIQWFSVYRTLRFSDRPSFPARAFENLLMDAFRQGEKRKTTNRKTHKPTSSTKIAPPKKATRKMHVAPYFIV